MSFVKTLSGSKFCRNCVYDVLCDDIVESSMYSNESITAQVVIGFFDLVFATWANEFVRKILEKLLLAEATVHNYFELFVCQVSVV